MLKMLLMILRRMILARLLKTLTAQCIAEKSWEENSNLNYVGWKTQFWTRNVNHCRSLTLNGCTNIIRSNMVVSILGNSVTLCVIMRLISSWSFATKRRSKNILEWIFSDR